MEHSFDGSGFALAKPGSMQVTGGQSERRNHGGIDMDQKATTDWA
ncbi:Unknown protein sequence [Pseudomonas syringae pv. cilantro]|uniref:Uncharacterized protein n=1 Tax=Pseudomonas syringae pv. cilantro TaxID=81035 RepID=A0A0N0XAX2_PSESX|nr:Unknown protein sequence [Pseudomonas syringae pv. cilantro]